MATNIPKPHRERAARKSGVKHEALWQKKNMRDRQAQELEEENRKLQKKQQLREPMAGLTMVSGKALVPTKKQPAGKKGM